MCLPPISEFRVAVNFVLSWILLKIIRASLKHITHINMHKELDIQESRKVFILSPKMETNFCFSIFATHVNITWEMLWHFLGDPTYRCTVHVYGQSTVVTLECLSDPADVLNCTFIILAKTSVSGLKHPRVLLPKTRKSESLGLSSFKTYANYYENCNGYHHNLTMDLKSFMSEWHFTF